MCIIGKKMFVFEHCFDNSYGRNFEYGFFNTLNDKKQIELFLKLENLSEKIKTGNEFKPKIKSIGTIIDYKFSANYDVQLCSTDKKYNFINFKGFSVYFKIKNYGKTSWLHCTDSTMFEYNKILISMFDGFRIYEDEECYLPIKFDKFYLNKFNFGPDYNGKDQLSLQYFCKLMFNDTDFCNEFLKNVNPALYKPKIGYRILQNFDYGFNHQMIKIVNKKVNNQMLNDLNRLYSFKDKINNIMKEKFK